MLTQFLTLRIVVNGLLNPLGVVALKMVTCEGGWKDQIRSDLWLIRRPPDLFDRDHSDRGAWLAP